ncbi:MAG: right-handed parallel beta-helix repeat-containing protein [Actinomycetota bacterium]|nr:right-handed parallel beta-helix repeat-containing protein [Actinomycetota bacterium]
MTVNLNGHRVFAARQPRVGDFAGIHFHGAKGATVVGGEVTGFDAGVWVEAGAQNDVKRLTIHDNVGAADPASTLGDGIVVMHSPSNRIVGNVVIHNGIFDGVGLLGLGTDNNVVQQNVIKGTAAGQLDVPGLGTAVIINAVLETEDPRRGESLHANNVIGNDIEDNVNSGISNLSNIGALIQGNFVRNNGLGVFPGNGIGVQALMLADQATLDTVESNVVDHNGSNGIIVLSQRNKVINNVAKDNNVLMNGSFDLNDQNGPDTTGGPPCDSNVWSGNVWGSGGVFPDCARGTVQGAVLPAPALAAAGTGDAGHAQMISEGRHDQALDQGLSHIVG